jgi:hypothetical protein
MRFGFQPTSLPALTDCGQKPSVASHLAPPVACAAGGISFRLVGFIQNNNAQGAM